MKAERNIEWNLKDNLSGVIDECAVVAIAESDSRESFAEILSMRELHRQYERSGFIDVTPFARVRDQADVGDSRLPDVDRCQTFREIINDVELWFHNDAPGSIDEELFLAGGNKGETFMKFVRAVELNWDDQLATAIDKSPLAVFFNGKKHLLVGGLILANNPTHQYETSRR